MVVGCLPPVVVVDAYVALAGAATTVITVDSTVASRPDTTIGSSEVQSAGGGIGVLTMNTDATITG